MNEGNGHFDRKEGKSPVLEGTPDFVQIKKALKQAVNNEKVPEHLRAMIVKIVRNS